MTTMASVRGDIGDILGFFIVIYDHNGLSVRRYCRYFFFSLLYMTTMTSVEIWIDQFEGSDGVFLMITMHFTCKWIVNRTWHIKGGHLDFSHLTELKNIYITEIYMKKQYKSSWIKNHRITKKKKKWWGSLKRLHNLLSYFQIWC